MRMKQSTEIDNKFASTHNLFILEFESYNDSLVWLTCFTWRRGHCLSSFSQTRRFIGHRKIVRPSFSVNARINIPRVSCKSAYVYFRKTDWPSSKLIADTFANVYPTGRISRERENCGLRRDLASTHEGGYIYLSTPSRWSASVSSSTRISRAPAGHSRFLSIAVRARF